jgi:cytidylate kinase
MNKGFGALKKAEDAIELDTSYMTIEEVVSFIYNKAMELM